MRCNPLRWLWGLLPVALLAGLAVQVSHESIEAELRSTVDQQLRASGFGWAKSAFSGRDGVITGLAADDADPARAYDVARSLWGVRTVDNQSTVIEKIADYRWSAKLAAGNLVLGGYVPTDSVRGDILKAARSRFPGTQITDEMKLARGVPSGPAWLAGVNFGLKELASLKGGEVRLKGLALSLSGEAADTKAYASVTKAFANELPADVQLVDDRISAPVVSPFIWTARQSNGRVALTGVVPARARAEVLSAARSAFPNALAIDDKAEAAEGAAPGYDVAVKTLLRSLARLEDGGRIEIRDAAATIEGLAASPEIADTVRGELGRGLKGFALSDLIKARDTGPKPVVPYTTMAVAEAGAPSVVLSGYAPSEEARANLVRAAQSRFPGRRVVNQLEVAPGAPEGWLKCLDGALLGTSRAGGGKAALTGRRIDVSGATSDEALAGTIPGEVRQAVGGDCEASVRIDVLAETIPETVWRAVVTGPEVVLEGDVINAAAKASLEASARRVFTGRTIIDRMRIVEARSPSWPSVAEMGLAALSEVQKGEATLARGQLTVTGQVPDRAAEARARERLAQRTAKGYATRNEITVAAVAAVSTPPPPTQRPILDPAAAKCQSVLQDTAREGMIRFERASATLTPDSFPTLDKLASVVRTCPEIVVEIEGHTDSEGTPDRKQALSDRRAQSVVDYLVQGGVDARRMTAIGYGDSRPLVPNTTAENRAKNRRIEFTVKR